MKTIKVLILFTCIGFSTNIFSQVTGFRKDNVLLPEKLIFSEHVGFDKLFTYNVDSLSNDSLVKPFFEIKKYIDFTKILAEKAMDETIKVYDASQYSDQYPYSALIPGKQLLVNEVKKNLGQDTFIVINSFETGEERKVVKMILLEELSSLNFYEDWSLSLDPLSFKKTVYAIEPIRRYFGAWSDDTTDYRYLRTFRFYNDQVKKGDKSNLKLIANVKYEHFFNLDQSFRDKKFKSLVEMFFSQNEKNFDMNFGSYSVSAPFFNGFNQRMFIQTLLDNAFSGKVKVTEFEGDKVLTPDEAHSKVFEPVIVKVMNFENGLDEDRTVINDYTSEIVSVIFIEDWYFDEATLQFEKKVVGIAPVRYSMDWKDDKSVLKRKVLFTIRLSDK